jgi:F0F1-type ATP synthase assembly protein I
MANNTGTRQQNEERTLGQTAADLKNKAKDAASNVADKARDTASAVASQAKDVAANIGSRAEDAAGSVGHGMQSLAGTIRDKAPQGGVMGSAATSVANALESSGKYLEEEGLSGMGQDVTELIRRNPIPAMLIGVGIGYLLARALRG